MGAKARFLLPGMALLVIALLLGIFVKTVVAEGSARGLRDDVWSGETPPAPSFELARLDRSRRQLLGILVRAMQGGVAAARGGVAAPP
jgi:hypothetical protein